MSSFSAVAPSSWTHTAYAFPLPSKATSPGVASFGETSSDSSGGGEGVSHEPDAASATPGARTPRAIAAPTVVSTRRAAPRRLAGARPGRSVCAAARWRVCRRESLKSSVISAFPSVVVSSRAVVCAARRVVLCVRCIQGRRPVAIRRGLQQRCERQPAAKLAPRPTVEPQRSLDRLRLSTQLDRHGNGLSA